jgi:heme/copper-type cytochrome/quinol oxidase subunit 4
MKKFIISLGKIDKKLFWVFSFALVQVIINLLSYYYPKEKTYQIMDSYSICFGQMLVILIPRLIGYKEKIIKKDEICTKKNLK